MGAQPVQPVPLTLLSDTGWKACATEFKELFETGLSTPRLAGEGLERLEYGPGIGDDVRGQGRRRGLFVSA